MAIGYISGINKKRRYGFIDCPELQLDYIFFHKTNCDKSYRNIYKGDKVSFDIVEKEGKEEAQNISFIQNANLDGLRKDFEKQTKLKGFLKKVEEHYYVEDRDTYIYIRLLFSENENNLKENYGDKLNQLIEYKIVSITDKNKIRAINFNRTFLPECYLILEKKPIEGRVISSEEGVYKIKVYDKIIGFIPASLALKRTPKLEPEEIISVTCIKANEDLDYFLFDLAENIELKNTIENGKRKQLESVKIGDSILGEIKSITSYGIFVSLGFIDGLLHISDILVNYIKDDSKNKQYRELLAETFLKGAKIQVVIECIENEKYSLVLDNTNELNKKLLQEINEKQV